MSTTSGRSEARPAGEEPGGSLPAGSAGLTNPPGTPPRIAFADVSKYFGATVALDGVTFEVAPGEIVGLLGHNGAGKSTLINVASGALQPSTGRMLLDGRFMDSPSPAAMAEAGLCVVSQVPALIPGISILDNLFLGDKRRSTRAQRIERAHAALTEVGLGHLSLRTIASQLSVGERQLVDLARGLVRGDIRILLLDEPTAALGLPETANLHRLVRGFAASGTAVVYVSHRLPDIMDICSRAVVLNAGAVVLDASMDGLSLDDLAAALAPGFTKAESTTATPGEIVLGVHDPDPDGLELEFRAGEVVGIFGMAAGIEFDILTAAFGLGRNRKTTGLTFDLHGRPFTPRSPRQAIRAGVHLVPADRETDGLAHNLSARDNVMLPWFGSYARAGAIGRTTGVAAYEEGRTLFNVQGPPGTHSIDEFSGGNRQKHLIARWTLPRRPELLLLLQPTQGVDVGGKNDIIRAVQEYAAQGMCVVVASSESDEIMRMCHRAYVVYGHRHALIPAGADMEGQLLSTLLALAGDAVSTGGQAS
ncbi:ATP-binding cassette domain-containing protein [Propionicicella superfundia]|uniref:ATP-binding cassette domain-containing protein n=1 Tax=Propionicicella superfundia TaxID=348582 RepID=UPI000685E2B5|nr:sugar ABC transporter ATP-binding protein [Propionicicella superfundia]